MSEVPRCCMRDMVQIVCRDETGEAFLIKWKCNKCGGEQMVYRAPPPIPLDK